MNVPETTVEGAEDCDGGRAQLVGRDLGGVQAGHGRDGEGVEALEQEDDGDGAVGA